MLAAVRPLLAASPCLPLSSTPRAPTPAPCLDRRGGPRRRDGDPVVDPFTAASHRPLPLTFAVGFEGQWALLIGISVSPHGVLLRALDPHEAALEAPGVDVLAAWRRLGTRIGAQASPLWFSTACIGARALVATLAEYAGVEVMLMPLHGAPGPVAAPLRGTLSPLSDPSPHVLGIALGDAELDALAELAAAPAARARSPRPAPDDGVSDITPEPPSLGELRGEANVVDADPDGATALCDDAARHAQTREDPANALPGAACGLASAAVADRTRRRRPKSQAAAPPKRSAPRSAHRR